MSYYGYKEVDMWADIIRPAIYIAGLSVSPIAALFGVIYYHCEKCEAGRKIDMPKDATPPVYAQAVVDKTVPSEPILIKKGSVENVNRDEGRERK